MSGGAAFFSNYHFPIRGKSTESDTVSDKNDSIWSVIAGVAKGYPQFTHDFILYELSYANLILYCSVLPSYDDEKENEIINADDPRNREKVKNILFGK